MRQQPRPSADVVPAAASAPTASIEDLIARGSDLKGELVAFAYSPRFSKQLTALLRDAAGHNGYLDEHTAVLTVDHFALQHRLPGGRTVLERFVAQRRPPLSGDEREMLLGWGDVVEGCFEVERFEQSAVMLHNLIDDVSYRVYSNMGRSAFTQLRKGMFVVGRIVPVHPATDAWLVSGHYTAFPKSAGGQLAQTALKTLTAHPELLGRNPDMLRRAWEIQAEHRADFIALVGSDLVVLPPEQAQETLREHYRRHQRRVLAGRKSKAVERAKAAGPTPEELGRLPEELFEATTSRWSTTRSKGSPTTVTSAAWMPCSPIRHWPTTARTSRSCGNTCRMIPFPRWRSAAWCSATPKAPTRSFALSCASPASPGSGTGSNCYDAASRRSSTVSRPPASPRSATASPNSSAPAGREVRS